MPPPSVTPMTSVVGVPPRSSSSAEGPVDVLHLEEEHPHAVGVLARGRAPASLVPVAERLGDEDPDVAGLEEGGALVEARRRARGARRRSRRSPSSACRSGGSARGRGRSSAAPRGGGCRAWGAGPWVTSPRRVGRRVQRARTPGWRGNASSIAEEEREPGDVERRTGAPIELRDEEAVGERRRIADGRSAPAMSRAKCSYAASPCSMIRPRPLLFVAAERLDLCRMTARFCSGWMPLLTISASVRVRARRYEVGRQQRRRREPLVEVLEDRQRLREGRAPAVVLGDLEHAAPAPSGSCRGRRRRTDRAGAGGPPPTRTAGP